MTSRWRRTYTVAKPAPMKASVAAADRGENRDRPQTP
jgi:hypothetical protein